MSDEQMKWLMQTIGLGGLPVKKFDVEYLTVGGGYNFTSINASDTPELIEATLEHNSNSGEVTIISFSPNEVGAKKKFHLLNASRM